MMTLLGVLALASFGIIGTMSQDTACSQDADCWGVLSCDGHPGAEATCINSVGLCVCLTGLQVMTLRPNQPTDTPDVTGAHGVTGGLIIINRQVVSGENFTGQNGDNGQTGGGLVIINGQVVSGGNFNGGNGNNGQTGGMTIINGQVVSGENFTGGNGDNGQTGGGIGTFNGQVVSGGSFNSGNGDNGETGGLIIINGQVVSGENFTGQNGDNGQTGGGLIIINGQVVSGGNFNGGNGDNGLIIINGQVVSGENSVTTETVLTERNGATGPTGVTMDVGSIIESIIEGLDLDIDLDFDFDLDLDL